MNTTQQQTLKPITKRAYLMLVSKVRTAELAADLAMLGEATDENSPVSEKAEATEAAFRELAAKLEAYSVPCPGSAHSPEVGGMQDNCMLCAPQWGQIQNPTLVKQ